MNINITNRLFELLKDSDITLEQYIVLELIASENEELIMGYENYNVDHTQIMILQVLYTKGFITVDSSPQVDFPYSLSLKARELLVKTEEIL